MFQDLQILRLIQKHLIGVLAGLKPGARGGGVHRVDLLGDLVCGVFVAEEEDEDGLEAEEVEEVPGEAGDPADVEVAGGDAGLEHGFEAEG